VHRRYFTPYCTAIGRSFDEGHNAGVRALPLTCKIDYYLITVYYSICHWCVFDFRDLRRIQAASARRTAGSLPPGYTGQSHEQRDQQADDRDGYRHGLLQAGGLLWSMTISV
jgi:hypothetical protein